MVAELLARWAGCGCVKILVLVLAATTRAPRGRGRPSIGHVAVAKRGQLVLGLHKRESEHVHWFAERALDCIPSRGFNHFLQYLHLTAAHTSFVVVRRRTVAAGLQQCRNNNAWLVGTHASPVTRKSE